MREPHEPAPHELLALLQGHHLQLTRRQAQIVALDTMASSPTAISLRLGLSLRTIQTHRYRAWASLTPDEIIPSRQVTTLWSLLHRKCCLVIAFSDVLGESEIA